MVRGERECIKCGSESLDYCDDCRTYSLCDHCDFCSCRDCYEYKK